MLSYSLGTPHPLFCSGCLFTQSKHSPVHTVPVRSTSPTPVTHWPLWALAVCNLCLRNMDLAKHPHFRIKNYLPITKLANGCAGQPSASPWPPLVLLSPVISVLTECSSELQVVHKTAQKPCRLAE